MAARLDVGDTARVTARTGLVARQRPHGADAVRDGRTLVRPLGFTFDVTDLDRGFARARRFWYAVEFLEVVASRSTVGGPGDGRRPVPAAATAERVPFRGRLVCGCVATSLPVVEQAMIEAGVIRSSIDITQGGYNTGGVAASAGTHDRGGNVDVRQFSDPALRIWREHGWAMQARSTAQGFSTAHGHGFPVGCPHLSAGGRHQASEWQAGRNGLRGRGPITGPGPKGPDTPRWDDVS